MKRLTIKKGFYAELFILIIFALICFLSASTLVRLISGVIVLAIVITLNIFELKFYDNKKYLTAVFGMYAKSICLTAAIFLAFHFPGEYAVALLAEVSILVYLILNIVKRDTYGILLALCYDILVISIFRLL